MAKEIIRLTESDLHNIIKESVKRILKEDEDWKDAYNKYMDFTGVGLHDSLEKQRRGEELRNDYIRKANIAFGGDPEKREFNGNRKRFYKEMDKLHRLRDIDREQRVSGLKSHGMPLLDWEKQWDIEYNRKNGIEDEMPIKKQVSPEVAEKKAREKANRERRNLLKRRKFKNDNM